MLLNIVYDLVMFNLKILIYLFDKNKTEGKVKGKACDQENDNVRC